MSDIVQKLWGFCHTLRHDGIDYGDYIEQITYLLFLKMADERDIEEMRDPLLGNRYRTRRLSVFFSRTPSATTAVTCAGEHAPSAPAISMAAHASQHSASAMA